MRIINSPKFAEQFNELYDWVDDDTVEVLDAYEANDIDVMDYDALENGEVPIMKIDDEGVQRVLVDNLQDPQMQESIIEEQELIPEEEIAIEGEDVPDFKSVQEAMSWAIENHRVVKIFYTTKGEKRSKDSKKYLLREKKLPKTQGVRVNIYRIVEPHYIYQAGNGNLILVTYDRSVKNIRAFIIDNITDYNFTQNRKSKKPQYFKSRMKVMPKSNKRIDTMKNINNNLIEMEATFKTKGLIKSAEIIQNAKSAWNDFKIAQYVGIQGYWIRNRRCWDNCYRQKRTTQPDTPAQEVWMECWDEYKESINNDESGWEKYAEKDKNIKLSAKEEQNGNKLFITKVSKKVKEGYSTPEAVYSTIEEESQTQIDKMLESSSQLMDIADALSSNNMNDLGEKVAEISSEMLKEAGMGDFWKNIKNMWKKKQNPEETTREIIDKLTQVQLLVEDALRNINRQYEFASDKKIIIEAGKKVKIAQVAPSVTDTGTISPVSTVPGNVPQAPSRTKPESTFRNFRIVYNTVKALWREFGALSSQVPPTSPTAKYLNAALDNFGDFVSQVDTHYNNKTLNNEIIAPLLQNLSKATMNASRGLSSTLGEVSPVAPALSPASTLAPAPASEIAPAPASGQVFSDSPSQDPVATQGIPSKYSLTGNKEEDLNKIEADTNFSAYIRSLSSLLMHRARAKQKK